MINLFVSLTIYLFWLLTLHRETLHVSYDRWKNLEVHCNNDQSIHHSPLSKSETTKHKLPELSFNRLQPTEEHCGLKKHSFGRFVAREAMLDEEYWVGFAPYLFAFNFLELFSMCFYLIHFLIFFIFLVTLSDFQ